MESEDPLLKDEYGVMDDSGDTFVAKNFALDSGEVLEEARVRYKTWGTLNEEKDNVLVVCHALTGNADVSSWWGDFLGHGKPFDLDKYFVVCANMLGSCYGSSGPKDVNPSTGKPFGLTFPRTTVRDSVRLHSQMVREGLGAKRVACAIGGSLGGMQVLEWMLLGSDFVKAGIPMACGAHHHAWQIAISEAQRQAIYADPLWENGQYDLENPPHSGLSVARQIAMISYRTHSAYETKFGRELQPDSVNEQTFAVEGYLRHQGKKFLPRFDPASYVRMTQMMDTHNVAAGEAEGRGETAAEVLSKIKQPALIVSISSDVLYPVAEQEFLAKHIPNSQLELIESPEGHDGFLLEQGPISILMKDFLTQHG
eukprot:g5732.t1